MKNFLFKKISLIFFIFGIFVISILTIFLEPPKTDISKIDKKMLDSYVKIYGYLESKNKINSSDSNINVLVIEDKTGKIKAILRENWPLEKNQKLEIVGKVSEYKGEIQIEVLKMRIIE